MFWCYLSFTSCSKLCDKLFKDAFMDAFLCVSLLQILCPPLAIARGLSLHQCRDDGSIGLLKNFKERRWLHFKINFVTQAFVRLPYFLTNDQNWRLLDDKDDSAVILCPERSYITLTPPFQAVPLQETDRERLSGRRFFSKTTKGRFFQWRNSRSRNDIFYLNSRIIWCSPGSFR